MPEDRIWKEIDNLRTSAHKTNGRLQGMEYRLKQLEDAPKIKLSHWQFFITVLVALTALGSFIAQLVVIITHHG